MQKDMLKDVACLRVRRRGSRPLSPSWATQKRKEVMGKQDMALRGGIEGRLAAEATSRPRTRVTVLAKEEGFSLLGLFI